MKKSTFSMLSAPIKFLRRASSEQFSPEPTRDEFDRDRDRILYSKAFRRLSGKTQVFIPKQDDHLRNRMTHTLEVAQLARTISKNLGLNETLVEAIALGHDLGHTPFGHIGEETLNQVLNNCDKVGHPGLASKDKGFKHNFQGLRVLIEKEKIYDLNGLNMSNYTLWGILNHTKRNYKTCPYFGGDTTKNCFLLRNSKTCPSQGKLDLGFYTPYLERIKYENNESWSFEGLIVGIADEIAQRQHDTEDALMMGVVNRSTMLGQVSDCFQQFCQGNDKHGQTLQTILSKAKTARENREFLTYLSKFLVELYVSRIIQVGSGNLKKFQKEYGINNEKDFEQVYLTLDFQKNKSKISSLIQFDDEFLRVDDKFHDYLKNRIINSHTVQQMDGRGRFILRSLAKAYVTNPRQLFDSTVLWTFKSYDWKKYRGVSIEDKEEIGKMRDAIDLPTMRRDETFQIVLLRAMCDFISGMTDEFAIQQYKRLYG